MATPQTVLNVVLFSSRGYIATIGFSLLTYVSSSDWEYCQHSEKRVLSSNKRLNDGGQGG